MTTPAELEAKVAKLPVNLDRLNGIVNGPSNGVGSVVEVDGSVEVKSLARVIEEMSAALPLADPYNSVADALSMGVSAVTVSAPGTGGIDGLYTWSTTGGGGTGARGFLTISGGGVLAGSVVVEHRGQGYTSTPTIVIAGAPGVTGATFTVGRSTNKAPGEFFFVKSTPGSVSGFAFYKVDSGGTTATLQESFPGWASVTAIIEAASRQSVFPDPWFKWSGGNKLAEAGAGKRLYSQALLTNMDWDPTYKHAYGVGAWKYNSALSTSMGFNTRWDMLGADEMAIVVGDTISIGVLVVGSGGTVSLAGYDCSAITSGGYAVIGSTVIGTPNVAMDGTPKVLKIENHVVRSGSIGFAGHLSDVTASDFRVIGYWLVKGATAGDRPPSRVGTYERVRMLASQLAGVVNDTVTSDFIRSKVALPLNKADWATSYSEKWDAGTEAIVGSDLTGIGLLARTNIFSGFGFAGIPAPSSNVNFFNMPGLRQATGGTNGGTQPFKPWAKLRFYARTGAANTADDAGATILAYGEKELDPDVTEYSSDELWVAMRDWASRLTNESGLGTLKTVAPGDWGADVGIFYEVLAADGSGASVDETQGTRSDLPSTKRSYYMVNSTNGATAAWWAFSPNSDLAPIGIRLGYVADVSEGYQPSLALRTALADASSVSTEILESRGIRDTLDERLIEGLLSSGAPRTLCWGAERLWRRDMNLTALSSGASIIHVEGFWGDSWTEGELYWLQMHVERMVAKYGDGGPGAISFSFGPGATVGKGNARRIYRSTHSVGDWTCEHNVPTATGPSQGVIKSSTVGANIIVSADDHDGIGVFPTVPLVSMKLFWEATANGVIRYRWWDGSAWGSWSANMNVQGTVGSYQNGALTGMPATALWKLEIQVVSGAVALHLCDGRGAAPGYVAHKLGGAGTQAVTWLTQDATQFSAAVAALGVHSAFMMWMTNESASNVPPAVFKTNLATLADRILAGMTGGDLNIMVPCQSPGPDLSPANPTYSQDQYAAAASLVAIERGACFINYQSAFGRTPDDYKNGSARPMIGSDGYHPVNANASPTIPNALWRALAFPALN